MTEDEADARSIRTNLNRDQGARLAFRQSTYRGEAGISLSGRGPRGQRTEMWAKDWTEMIGLMLHSMSDGGLSW